MRLTSLAARALTSLVVMALAAMLTFLLIDLAPGSYVDDLAANPQVSRETVARLRDQFGLDRPFYEKFARWAGSLAHGDIGYSLVYQRPVRQLIAERLWNTVALNLAALALAWTIGLPLGLAAAANRGSPIDWTIGALAAVLLSTPAVVLALVVLACAARQAWPLGSMAWPTAAIAAVWLPAVARHTRSAVGSALDASHTLAARARGVGRLRLVAVHALREALGPLSSFVGISVAAVVSASLPVEVVTGWPGIGQLAFDAVLRRDLFLVVDLVQVAALLLLAGNLAGDLLLRAVDPRVA